MVEGEIIVIPDKIPIGVRFVGGGVLEFFLEDGGKIRVKNATLSTIWNFTNGIVDNVLATQRSGLITSTKVAKILGWSMQKAESEMGKMGHRTSRNGHQVATVRHIVMRMTPLTRPFISIILWR